MLSLPFLNLVKFAGRASERATYFARALQKMRRKTLPLSDPDNITWLAGAYGSIEWTSRYLNVRTEDIIKDVNDSIKLFEDRSLYDILSLLGVFGEGCVTRGIWSKLGEDQRKIFHCPYTSAEMLNYIYTVSWGLKLEKPKNILRHVGAELKIPKFIVSRPKSGFGITPEHWFGGGWLEPLIPLAAKVFPKKEIHDLKSISLEKASTFWNVLNYSVWTRLMINNEPLEALSSELEESILQTFPEVRVPA